MRPIPVIDIKAGRAVRAVAGDRTNYENVRSILHEGSDPIHLALAYRDILGLSELYLADLDSIAGAPPALPLIGELARLDFRLWIDAGLRDRTLAHLLLEAGVATLVAGLETVAGPAALAGIIQEAGVDRLAFSLDLRDGRPICAPGADWGTADPLGIAERVVRFGLRTMILLDLARVGIGEGLGTLLLLGEILRAAPSTELVVGGGVSGPADLERAARAGASAVLLASTLHDGRIGRAELNGILQWAK